MHVSTFIFCVSVCEILKPCTAQLSMECDATIFKEASIVVYFQVMHLFTWGLKIKPGEDRGENIKRREEAGRVSEHLSVC